jgi:hypothetical protein
MPVRWPFRKIGRGIKALSAAGLLSLTSGQFVSANDQPPSLSLVYYKIFEYFDKADDHPELDRNAVLSVRERVRALQNVTDRFQTSAIASDYIKALSIDADALISTLGNSDAVQQTLILHTVENDLNIKLRYESAISGAKDIFRGKVKVSVRPLQSGSAIAGLK